MKEKPGPVGNLVNWYFSKKVLPYWVILLADSVIVFVSAVFTYWLINRSQVTFDNHRAVFFTSLMYAVLSLVGARIFRTYSGVLRYSSFVDLLKLIYANLVTLALALGLSLLFGYLGVDALSALTPVSTFAAILVSTLLMWALRILVKLVFDATNMDTKAQRVLIYGAITGGVGLAKNIRSQNPVRYELCGFISHEHRIKDMHLLGVRVYNLDDDIAAVIRSERIQAVLISPMRINEFRQNQKIQDVIIGCGCKILMAHEVEEARIKDGELKDGGMQGILIKEVSVEDLLPRSEIRVDMKSVGEQLAGKKVLITGSAGSIGMEIVRQVAAFNPEKMMLIDQAETPQHDVRLMMARDFPGVPS